MEATMTFSRSTMPLFFKGVSHDDLKWSINYLLGLLEIPEAKPVVNKDEEFIKELLSMPENGLSAEEEIKAIEENRKTEYNNGYEKISCFKFKYNFLITPYKINTEYTYQILYNNLYQK